MKGIRDGNLDEATNTHMSEYYIQHSTVVKSQKSGFLEFFKEFHKANPEREMRIVRSIEDGPYIFLHVHQILNGGERQWICMDIFDTDKEGRLREHWDVIEAYTTETKSGEDMAAGPSLIEDIDKTEENKELVHKYVKLVLTEGFYDRLGQFVADDLIQHTFDLEGGLTGLKKGLENGVAPHCEFLFHIIGQGNMVVTFCKTRKNKEEHATFDVYRVANGLIREHWSSTEPIPPRDQWINAGKF